MMYFLGLFSDISVSIGQAIRTLFGNLSAIIYDFIVVVYDLFVTLSRAEILDSAFIQKIYEKVGLVLGLFMMFKLIFSLLQHLLDPNKFNDKKNGFASIIQRSVIAIVLLGTVPSIFRLAFDIQNFIVGDNNGNNNVIYKLIIGDSISTNVSDFGTKMASDLFFSFYKEEDGYVLDGGVSYDESGIPVFIDYDTLVDNIEGGDSFFTAVDYLAVRQNSTYVIDYNWLFSVAVGIFVVYILIMYIIQVGVRVVQLAYLQLIAPIPILSYISDPEGAFNKWIKQCISTYLDLFLRVAIIYFIVYLSSTIMNSFGNPSSVLINSLGANVSDSMIAWVKIFILIGLLLFAKKAPELIKDLFPKLGGGAGKFSFGLNPKKELWDPISKSLPGRAIGWGVRKGISTFDRKLHHLPAPRNKVQQWFDKVAPGHAEVVKNKNEIKDRKQLYDEGMKIHTRNGGTLSANDFSNDNYRKSWQAVKNAKDTLKTAEQDLDYWRNEVAQGRIDTTDSNYQDALKNQKAASARLEAAKRDHDNNRKIYVNDARREDAFGYYKDMQYGGSGGTPSGGSGRPSPGGSGGTPSGGSGRPSPGGSGGTPSGSSGRPSPGGSGGTPSGGSDGGGYSDIYVTERDIEDAYDKLYELTGSGASQEEVNEQLNWINDLTKENESNLEDAYSKLYELTGSGASQEEIDAQIKKINDIKSGEIN